MPYSEVRNYGFNIILRNYANYSCLLPLPCHIEHGWTPLHSALTSDLKTDKPLMLVFSKRRADAWKKRSNIPVAIMGSPFIHYKNIHKIIRRQDAQGTVAFPSHSTYDLNIQFNVKEYCRELIKLPKEFQPVTICLFWLDFIDKKADIYRKMGLKVISAGPKFTNSIKFVNNFYDILSNHKYATSNDIGSYVFYAIDFGTPFFLTGKPPIMYNSKLRDVNIGVKTRLADYQVGRKAIKLFSTGPINKITNKQKKFVNKEMGISSCLSSKNLNKLFWQYSKKNNYLQKFFYIYLCNTIFTYFVFNMPWTKYLISIRKRMVE